MDCFFQPLPIRLRAELAFRRTLGIDLQMLFLFGQRGLTRWQRLGCTSLRCLTKRTSRVFAANKERGALQHQRLQEHEA